MADEYVLLVEGKDDDSVFFHLLNHHQIPESRFKRKKKEGFSQVINDLDVEPDASGLERLGIVVDADVDLSARWQSLRNKLISCGYPDVPNAPLPEGTIVQEADRPLVGVWVMPDNVLPGMLEDFIRALVPDSDSLWNRAENCVNEISEPERRFSAVSKAYVHTWLAWQEEPGTLMGAAINKRYLNADALSAQQLMAWIRRLFDL